ncbi:3-keto-disaccharide hydrolase [Pseudomonas sp. CGJS7]|uniref:3-keto-disaccharide hydrolase n=1 Tax=Pseudomonas sp. CGJS7 TaxID=3109348 RepID=UPI0030087D9A
MNMKLLGACLLALTCGIGAQAAEQPGKQWQSLFDGKTLDGWRASEKPGSFSVRDGQIVVRGPRSHLYYVGEVQRHDLRDFELQLQVMTKPGANSGVYFHTAWQQDGWPGKGYEVQVNNSQSDPKRTGGLYGVQDNYQAPAKDNVWFTMRIRVEGNRVRTFVDGKQIVDYTQPERLERPEEMKGRVLSSGTFALQAHDPDSEVHYRNIKVRALP